jgi:hypothetical protein
MSGFPYPPDQTSEDVDRLVQAAAQIAVDRGHVADAPAYAFTLLSLALNQLFAGNFPADPPTYRRGLHAV